jgi:hypothetical protein
MLRVSVNGNTASTMKFVLSDQVTFSSAVLWVSVDGESDYVRLDIFDATTSSSKLHVLRIDSSSGEIIIDLNQLPFDSIYYKKFHIEFMDENSVLVDKTYDFSISPEGIDALYGIVKKLTFDFNQMVKFSGISVRLFIPSLTTDRCPDCWDEDLGQSISTSCQTCNGTGASNMYDPIDIMCLKKKTQSKQQYSEKGSVVQEQSVFQTYARADFTKGILFADLSSKNIYEISDRNIANVGGIRTSTMFYGKLIKPNDSRVSAILSLIN